MAKSDFWSTLTHEIRENLKPKTILVSGALMVLTVIVTALNVSVRLWVYTFVVLMLSALLWPWIEKGNGRKMWFVVLLLVYVVYFIRALMAPQMQLVYDGRRLDGRQIYFADDCAPPSSLHLEMCVESPGHPEIFELNGVAMFADRAIEVREAVMEFSDKVEISQHPNSCWTPANEDKTTYGCFLNKESIPGGLPFEVGAFVGTPTPSKDVVVNLWVYYGDDKTAHARFVLKAVN